MQSCGPKQTLSIQQSFLCSCKAKRQDEEELILGQKKQRKGIETVVQTTKALVGTVKVCFITAAKCSLFNRFKSKIILICSKQLLILSTKHQRA